MDCHPDTPIRDAWKEPPQAGERAEASALTRAREYLRGIDTDGYRYDHPITILAALVAEIDAAPVVDVFKYRGSITIELDDESLVGKRVRLLALDSGGAKGGGNLPPPLGGGDGG